jgi:hypothetical protein
MPRKYKLEDKLQDASALKNPLAPGEPPTLGKFISDLQGMEDADRHNQELLRRKESRGDADIAGSAGFVMANRWGALKQIRETPGYELLLTLCDFEGGLTSANLRKLRAEYCCANSLTPAQADELPSEVAAQRMWSNFTGKRRSLVENQARKPPMTEPCRRGRQTVGDIEKEEAFYADWDSSGLTLKEFAKDRGVPYPKAEAMTARARTRRNRAKCKRQRTE